MQGGRRAGVRLVCAVARSSTAAAGPVALQGISLPGLPFAPLRLLSGASQSSVPSGAPDAHEQQRQRRLSHYAATTSGGSSNSSSSSARGGRGLAAQPAYTYDQSQVEGGDRAAPTPPLQPPPQQPSASPRQQGDLLERAHLAAAALKARAVERLEEVNRLDATKTSVEISQLSFRERLGVLSAAPHDAGRLRLTRVKQVPLPQNRIERLRGVVGGHAMSLSHALDLAQPRQPLGLLLRGAAPRSCLLVCPGGPMHTPACPAPPPPAQEEEETDDSVWQRLGPMFSAGRSSQPTSAATAALSMYRQEVQRGQDVSAAYAMFKM